MSYREKSTWISFLTTLVVYAAYFTLVLRRSEDSPGLALFLGAVLTLLILQAVLHALASMTAPDEVHAPRGERDAGGVLCADRGGAGGGVLAAVWGKRHTGGARTVGGSRYQRTPALWPPTDALPPLPLKRVWCRRTGWGPGAKPLAFLKKRPGRHAQRASHEAWTRWAPRAQTRI